VTCVILVTVAEVMETEVAVVLTCILSPSLPALALSPAVVPTIPLVVFGVIPPVKVHPEVWHAPVIRLSLPAARVVEDVPWVAVAIWLAVTAPVCPTTLVTAPGDALIAAVVNAVVAICVVFVPGAAVGAVGVPVKAGDTVEAGVYPRAVAIAAAPASSFAVRA
jgi:hypothetical protein